MIKIAQYYKKEKKWLLAFTFCNLACSLPYPSESILFVDKNAYEYHRWHILGIVGYYCGKYEEGKAACLRAMERGLNTELDRNNLQFYIEKEKLDKEPRLCKKQFLQIVIKELQEKNVKLPIKKMHKLALSKWKNRNKV